MIQDQQTIGIVLLAGGSSSRLGSPKQMLMYHGKTFISRMLEIAMKSNGSPVVLVLGANAEILLEETSGSSAHIMINENWEEGIASSIRSGIRKLLEINPAVEAAIIMFCDQPMLSTDIVNMLIDAHKKTGKPIVTCSYDDTFGPPTLFHKTFFAKLLELQGDIGARNIVKDFADRVEAVFFPGGELDIDTKADYEKISKR